MELACDRASKIVHFLKKKNFKIEKFFAKFFDFFVRAFWGKVGKFPYLAVFSYFGQDSARPKLEKNVPLYRYGKNRERKV
jgi:hypothetical protein